MNKPTRYSIALLTMLTFSNANSVDLGEIEIISANKTKQNIKKTTSNVTVITEEDIRQNGYTSVPEVLSTALGMNVSQNGGIGQKSSFFLRGLESGKILVLVDGMRLNDPSTTSSMAMIEFLPISNVERIEIIRGGGSSVWGANASAGVINIITKNSSKDGVSGSIGLETGSHDTKGGNVSLFYKNGKLNAKLLSSYFDTDGISALAPQNSEKDGYNNKNMTAGFGYDFTDKTKASLTVMNTKTKGDFDSGNSNDKNSNFKTDSTNVLGLITTKIGVFDSVLNISRGEYERYYWGEYEATTNEYSLINSYSHSLGKSVLGLEYKDIEGIDPNAPSVKGYKNKGIFLSNSINPTDNLLIEGNLRYDDFDKFDGKTTCKVGSKYTLLNDFTIGANYYTSLNAPSVYQLANTLAGTTLKPSFTKGYDVSLFYKDYFSLTYFDNKIEDEFEYQDPAAYDSNWNPIGPYGYYNNSADENIKGVEISAKSHMIADRFMIKANYTHLIDLKDTSGTPLYNRAKDEFNANIEYFYDEDTIVSLNAQYTGERYSPFGYPVSPMPSGNYTVWNLNLTKKYNDNIDLGLHIKNLFDKDYQSVYGYNSEGRSIEAKLTYKF